MCQLCQKAFLRLRRDYSADTAMSLLWSITPFPIGDGQSTLNAVDRFLRVKRKNRPRWMRKQDNRNMRLLQEARDA